MGIFDYPAEPPANALCKSCGFCCNGNLFIWAKLRPSELDHAEKLGMKVFRDDPSQRGFSQPCARWKDQCTIYTSKHYPKVCKAYHCKLVKNVIADKISLAEALLVIEQTKVMVADLDALLPVTHNPNFRSRLVAKIETTPPKELDAEFKKKAEALLFVYEEKFGVSDLIEK